MFWHHGPSTVSQLIALMEEPHPPHSTISSIVRILEKKEFLTHKAYGRTYEYSPVVEKKQYSKFSLSRLVSNYFAGSMSELVSFLVEEDSLSLQELADLQLELDKQEQTKTDKS